MYTSCMMDKTNCFQELLGLAIKLEVFIIQTRSNNFLTFTQNMFRRMHSRLPYENAPNVT
jgi:hypothetical protein